MAIWYVSVTTGNDSNDGTSIANACATLSKAGELVAAGGSAGDVIYVAPGTYRGAVDLNGSGDGLDGTAAAPIKWIGDVNSEVFNGVVEPGIVRLTLSSSENIDKIIAMIRGSKDPETAKQSLIQTFSFSEKQTKAILDMRLQKLTSLEIDKVVEEFNELQNLIKSLNEILKSQTLQNDIIIKELDYLFDKYGDERRTEIIPFSGDLSVEDMIAQEDMVLTITHQGYIKRLATAQWKTQKRGGRGMKGAHTKDDDFVEHLFIASAHCTILFFSDRGKCYWLKVHQIPMGSRISQGRAIINLIDCEPGEKVQAFVSVKEFNDTDYIVMATKNGMIKRSALSLYSKPRKNGIYAIEVRDNDELIQAVKQLPLDRVLIETDSPYLIPRSLKKSRRNEPMYLPVIAEKLAAEMGIGPSALVAHTVSNSMKLFNLINC